MGMDLIPLLGDVPDQHYNWSRWFWLWERLTEWGVDTSSLSSINDHSIIPEKTCIQIANAIEAHLHDFDESDQEWLALHAARWRRSGGFEQW